MRKTSSFFCGMVLMALLVSITGTALAASNAISFNTANLSINGKRIVDKGDVLESSAGAELPSIIRYTDSNGSATHYVSVRFLAEALGMDVSWRGSNSTIDVEAEGDAALYTMALDNAGVIFDNGELEEITPLTSNSGKVILKETNQSDDPFESTLNPKEEDGDYISITVTNSGKYPLEFDLGRQLPSTNVTNPSAVPAGQSATRTIKINTWESIESKPVYFKVGNAEYITRSMDFTVEVRQFSK